MNRHPGRPRQAGFTLIELLVAAVILGVVGVFASSTLISRVTSRGLAEPVASMPELPLSPGELLVRLAGIAVLLFGAGFWYAAELDKPGRLDRFHLGQFLLLALTYCLFFVTFGVLYEEQLFGWLAVLLATAVSSPLVVLHVASVVDLRFALRYALPLFLLTTGIVVNGAYGGELRAYIYLAMACVVVAFLTLSHPRLQRARSQRTAAIEHDLERRILTLQSPLQQLRTAVGNARQLLRRPDRDEIADDRAALEQRLERASRVLEEADSMQGQHEAFACATDGASRRSARDLALYGATRLAAKVPRQQHALDLAVAAITARRDRADRERRPRGPVQDHCVACGEASSADARFCSRCGQPGSDRRVCISCSAVLHLPRHLLRNGTAGPPPVTHCPGCGEAHAIAG